MSLEIGDLTQDLYSRYQWHVFLLKISLHAQSQHIELNDMHGLKLINIETLTQKNYIWTDTFYKEKNQSLSLEHRVLTTCRIL